MYLFQLIKHFEYIKKHVCANRVQMILLKKLNFFIYKKQNFKAFCSHQSLRGILNDVR